MVPDALRRWFAARRDRHRWWLTSEQFRDPSVTVPAMYLDIPGRRIDELRPEQWESITGSRECPRDSFGLCAETVRIDRPRKEGRITPGEAVGLARRCRSRTVLLTPVEQFAATVRSLGERGERRHGTAGCVSGYERQPTAMRQSPAPQSHPQDRPRRPLWRDVRRGRHPREAGRTHRCIGCSPVACLAVSRRHVGSDGRLTH